jgi:hypothetical protein
MPDASATKNVWLAFGRPRQSPQTIARYLPGHRQVALSAAIHGVSSLVSSLAAACSDSPQTVHVAFMPLKPLFFYGKGRHGESHREEEGQEENQADIKLQARVSYWAAPVRFRGSLIPSSG